MRSTANKFNKTKCRHTKDCFNKAISLRAHGKTHREIAKALKIGVSTAHKCDSFAEKVIDDLLFKKILNTCVTLIILVLK